MSSKSCCASNDNESPLELTSLSYPHLGSAPNNETNKSTRDIFRTIRFCDFVNVITMYPTVGAILRAIPVDHRWAECADWCVKARGRE